MLPRIGTFAFLLLVPMVLLFLIYPARDEANYTLLPRIIDFSGYQWTIKSSPQPVGPGPNYFSTNNVYVDRQGQLHLKIDRVRGHWSSAELIAINSLGYGEYSFTLGSLKGELSKTAKLGFFTWDDSPEEFHREIDIEIYPRQGDGISSAGTFSVQPWDKPGRTHGLGPVLPKRLIFDWRPDSVRFQTIDTAGITIDSWRFSGPDIPTPGNAKARINLWLVGGTPPAADEESIEAVIEEFSFQPYVPVKTGPSEAERR